MSDPAAMLRDARLASGLSARALALGAGVSTTTVTRVEAGTMDPTVGMLSRLLAAAGRTLELSMEEPQGFAAPLSLVGLSDAWTTGPLGERPDWTRLRAFLDTLALSPHQTRAAISRTPPPSGSPMHDALLAGIADKLADDQGLRRPAWTRAASRYLPSPWESSGTPRMRQAARDQAPPQLLDHGIIVALDSLWRDALTLGVAPGA